MPTSIASPQRIITNAHRFSSTPSSASSAPRSPRRRRFNAQRKRQPSDTPPLRAPRRQSGRIGTHSRARRTPWLLSPARRRGSRAPPGPGLRAPRWQEATVDAVLDHLGRDRPLRWRAPHGPSPCPRSPSARTAPTTTGRARGPVLARTAGHVLALAKEGTPSPRRPGARRALPARRGSDGCRIEPPSWEPNSTSPTSRSRAFGHLRRERGKRPHRVVLALPRGDLRHHSEQRLIAGGSECRRRHAGRRGRDRTVRDPPGYAGR